MDSTRLLADCCMDGSETMIKQLQVALLFFLFCFLTIQKKVFYFKTLTHEHGHTLDLFSPLLCHSALSDFILDHKCIIFNILLQSATQPQKCTVHSHFLNAHRANSFSPPPLSNIINDLETWFNNLCTSTYLFYQVHFPL